MVIFKFWKGVWPYWPATPISYRAKTNKWILLLSGSNFLFLWVDKQNRKFFWENLSQSVQMIFFLNSIWRHLWILGLTFLKKLISTPWENFSGKNSLFRLSTNKKEKIELLRSNIHLSVFALYEMGVAGQCGHNLFRN